MRTLILLLLATSLCAFGQTNTINATWTFRDFQQNSQAVKRTTLTPLAPLGGYNGAFLTASPMAQITSGAGSVTYSNLAPGYSYYLQIDTPYASTRITNGFPSGLTGNVNAYDYRGVLKADEFYFSQPNTNASAIIGTAVTNTQTGVTLGGTFSGNVPGLTNATTLWVSTNGGAGLRGVQSQPFGSLASAIAAASPKDTLKLSGQIPISSVQQITNLTVVGDGATINANVSVGPALLLWDGSMVDGLILSNSAAGEQAACIGNTNGTQCTIQNVKCYGAAGFMTANTTVGEWRNNPSVIRNSIFKNDTCCVETWRGYYNFDNDLMDSDNVAIVINDLSTNTYNWCRVAAKGGTDLFGIVHYGPTKAVFNNGVFSVKSNTPPNFRFIWMAESVGGNPTLAVYNHGTFDLRVPGTTGMVALGNDDQLAVAALLELNDCYYSPETNGVIFTNNQVNVTLRGGNFRPCNFSNPSKVSYGSPCDYARLATRYRSTAIPPNLSDLPQQLVGQNALATMTLLTNYDSFTTTGFNGSAANGTITNLVAGTYRISGQVSLWNDAAADVFHLQIFTNLTACTTMHASADKAASACALPFSDILALPANCRIDVRLSSEGQADTVGIAGASVCISRLSQ